MTSTPTIGTDLSDADWHRKREVIRTLTALYLFISFGVVSDNRGGKDKCVSDDAVSNGNHLPLKCAKLGEPSVVAFIGGEHADA
jgi:hypothetical protein